MGRFSPHECKLQVYMVAKPGDHSREKRVLAAWPGIISGADMRSRSSPSGRGFVRSNSAYGVTDSADRGHGFVRTGRSRIWPFGAVVLV